ncbi:MAG: TetR/AcrR family transcriptional regulator [Acidimicrobiales bacterium]
MKAPEAVKTSRPRPTQAERRAATRGALVDAARKLFAEHGYADSGLDEIVTLAGVTRGALYHHFETKAELFGAVVATIDDEFSAEVLDRARTAADARDAIRLGCLAYLDVGSRAEVARIMGDIASVLGAAAFRGSGEAPCAGYLRLALEAARDQGVVLPGEPPILATMLLGAMDAAVLSVAASHDRVAARAEVAATVDSMVTRLLGATTPD